MTHQKRDLVVVGGSFAGLACAQAAASRGLDTLVLERRLSPGQSPHTTGLLVKEVADEWDVPRSMTRKIHGVRLYSPSMHHVDLTRPGYYFLATDTTALLRWWADQARSAGAEVRCKSPYVGATHDGDRITLNRSPIVCDYLVGADGARSRVAEDFSLGRNRHLLAGIEAEYEGVRDIDEDRLHVFLDSQLAPGYIAWAVPGVNGITQVGLAAKKPCRLDLDAFVTKLRRVFNFDDAKIVGHRAGVIPVGGPVRRMSTRRVMLVGDAAGLVSPLTAGGIHTAIHYGRLAGVAICDHLLDAGPDPARAIRRELPTFLFKRLMRFAFDRRPANWVYDLAIDSPAAMKLAQIVFYHHRGLLSPLVWREMVWGARSV
ncbi:MAG: FAD-dependent oxidoreductase [Planctomycetes bacterium]|nr:FAD-dependent oxidoreductase [Planctomycetota bacterium]